MQDYINNYNQLDAVREGLDFQIEELLDDLEPEADFKNAHQDSKLGKLLTKVEEQSVKFK
jgi:hypothetical protein